MPVKPFLLATCAALALAIATGGLVMPGSTAAATAFDLDAARSPQPRALQPAALPAPRPAQAAPASPFVLALPKPAAAPAPEATALGKPEEIDLSALRYYAAQSDLGRVSAEIRRLRARHPDWEPPADLFSEGGSGIDEQPLWDLFARHDLTGIHTKIDEIRRDKPDWQPSNDLATKLALAEAHDGLVKASDAHDWAAVVVAASAAPGLLTTADLDALWRTAEALDRTGDETRAVAAYRYILSNCDAPALRLATVQKASGLPLSPEALQGLMEMGRRGPDGRGEFDGLWADLLRRRVGEATAAPSGAAADPQDLAALAANAATDAGDAQLLGWYARSRKDAAGAERWFRAALARGGSAKAAEGLVLALRDAGSLAEARVLALQYADRDPLNRKLMVEIEAASLAEPKAAPLSAQERTAFEAAVDALASANGAQALGWHLYKAGDVAGAEAWFRKSDGWQANESAATGLVVAAHRLRHTADYAARLAQYRAVYPRIAELDALMRPRAGEGHRTRVAARVERAGPRGATRVAATRHRAAPGGGGWDGSAEAIVKTYDAGQYDAAMAMLDQRHRNRTEPRGLAVVRGWAMYHRGDWEGAKQVFSSLDGGAYSQERQEGLRVIQQSYTNPRYR